MDQRLLGCFLGSLWRLDGLDVHIGLHLLVQLLFSMRGGQALAFTLFHVLSAGGLSVSIRLLAEEVGRLLHNRPGAQNCQHCPETGAAESGRLLLRASPGQIGRIHRGEGLDGSAAGQLARSLSGAEGELAAGDVIGGTFEVVDANFPEGASRCCCFGPRTLRLGFSDVFSVFR